MCLDYVPYVLNDTNNTNMQYVDDLLQPFNPPLVGKPVKPKTDGQVNDEHQTQIYIVTLQVQSKSYASNCL